MFIFNFFFVPRLDLIIGATEKETQTPRGSPSPDVPVITNASTFVKTTRSRTSLGTIAKRRKIQTLKQAIVRRLVQVRNRHSKKLQNPQASSNPPPPLSSVALEQTGSSEFIISIISSFQSNQWH